MRESPITTLQVLQGVFGSNAVHVAWNPHAQSTVVFFPGDRIQAAGLPERIARLQDPQHVARVLLTKFQAPHIYIVMPSRYEACFACFDHFLNNTTVSGEPLGYQGSTFKASQQLSSLLLRAGWDARLPCHLVGFSKGGTVLNQVLAEAAAFSFQHGDTGQVNGGAGQVTSPHLQATAAILSSVHQVHFVDAGLNSKGAHLTDPEAVFRLGAWCRQHPSLHLFLHGTPRQWDDARRPLVSMEKNRFAELCSAAGIPVHQHKYYEGGTPSLDMHFQCLEDFVVPRQE